MITATVFENNKTQAVRLPVDVRFDASIKKVIIRTLGKDRIISPFENAWDSFFLADELAVSDDFMNSRAEQTETSRESFDD
ncbi:type II toxin-antitoxin system VapB family antitoxin [Thiomicrorhabdus sp. Kp2]|uniref:type II toxin-antitoxin system VapB family antitoxin n=1 Tax=Thiomicrorhabdus sp. Kp2 TaxID=1123518 RepID=UPI00041B3909|nr:type II toxin-antitoxin system VapB family antitoxin [Thiomicrorhabdus sp. Kp2]